MADLNGNAFEFRAEFELPNAKILAEAYSVGIGTKEGRVPELEPSKQNAKNFQDSQTN